MVFQDTEVLKYHRTSKWRKTPFPAWAKTQKIQFAARIWLLSMYTLHSSEHWNTVNIHYCSYRKVSGLKVSGNNHFDMVLDYLQCNSTCYKAPFRIVTSAMAEWSKTQPIAWYSNMVLLRKSFTSTSDRDICSCAGEWNTVMEWKGLQISVLVALRPCLFSDFQFGNYNIFQLQINRVIHRCSCQQKWLNSDCCWFS